MLLRNTHTQKQGFQLPGSHRLRQAFPDPSSTPAFYHYAPGCRPQTGMPIHHTRNPRQVSRAHGLGSSAFARHYSQNIFNQEVLRCFTSPHTTSMLYIHTPATTNNDGQVSPFGHPRITASSSTPRGLTQTATSFFGPSCQGIHRTPLTPTKNNKIKHNKHTVHCHTQPTKSHASKDARIHYTIPKHHTNTPHTNTKVSAYEGSTGIEPKSLTACRACPKHPTTQQQPNIDHHSGIVISP